MARLVPVSVSHAIRVMQLVMRNTQTHISAPTMYVLTARSYQTIIKRLCGIMYIYIPTAYIERSIYSILLL